MVTPGQALLDLAARSTQELLLVAPYVKVAALERILLAVPASCRVRLVTRWRLEELALGVSDLDVFPLIRKHSGMLHLHPALHAKYYASGEEALVGSANITSAALGWRIDSNLEILVTSIDGRLTEFESELWDGLVAVDDKMYDAFRRALDVFPTPTNNFVEMPLVNFLAWRPTLRHPEDLQSMYAGRFAMLSTSSREAADLDLAALAPPIGMSRTQFDLWVGAQLRQHPEVVAIDRLLDRPRRFGEIRKLLSERGIVEPNRAWQTWMRWLLYFLPEDYSMQVANYSEIFARRDNPSSTGGI